MAAAQHGERGGSRAEYRHSFDAWGRLADTTCDGFGLPLVLAGDNDRRQPPERRHCGLASGLGLGDIKTGGVSRHQRGDHRSLRIVRLNQHPARLVATAGATGDLLDLLETALGGAQIATL